MRLKPAPLLGFSVNPASAGTASFAWLSMPRELAHKVSLCFSTPRRCWVWGVCRPYSGRSSPQAAHNPSPCAETRAITEIQRCRQFAASLSDRPGTLAQRVWAKSATAVPGSSNATGLAPAT